MATFVIIPTETNPKLDEIVLSKFGKGSYQLPKGEWLVSYDGTSKQLCEEIGITDDNVGGAIVLNFSGYWGLASKNIWEWLKENSD